MNAHAVATPHNTHLHLLDIGLGGGGVWDLSKHNKLGLLCVISLFCRPALLCLLSLGHN